MVERRRANLNPPTSIDEARRRLVEVAAEVDTIKAMMDVGTRLRPDGLPMTPDELVEWRKRATGAIKWFNHERNLLQAYVADYMRDVRAEEHAERQREHTRRQEQERLASLERKEALIAEWRAQIAELDADPSRKLTKEEKARRSQLEAQVARLVRILATQAGEAQRLREAREAKRQKREAHERLMLEQAQLAVDEPINPDDPYNLLRHAYRVFVQMAREKRVTFADNEKAFINLLERIGRESLNR